MNEFQTKTRGGAKKITSVQARVEIPEVIRIRGAIPPLFCHRRYVVESTRDGVFWSYEFLKGWLSARLARLDCQLPDKLGQRLRALAAAKSILR